MNATPSDSYSELLAKITSRQARAGIIGLGYLGLPLAIATAEHGYPVTGFDIDEEKIRLLAVKQSYFSHISDEAIARLVESDFEATTDFSRLREQDIIIICLPTPLSVNREPDTSYIEQSAGIISTHLRPGQLITLESTTYPGTSRELIKPILESSGLRCGEDFFLAYSPEREDPGNSDYHTRTIPKVVGGHDQQSTLLADEYYKRIVDTTVVVSSLEAAEAVKITENVFRAVNIALVNELKVIFDRMDINVWEVIDAASTKPFGYMRFEPGPGWGGHCIPIDPFYLSWKAREYGQTTRFIEIAGEINVSMPFRVIDKTADLLNAKKRSVKGSKVLILGVAYKRDINDIRESPALVIIDELKRRGATVSYHDPFIGQLHETRKFADLSGMESQSLTAGKLAQQDAVIVVTDHSDVDYRLVVEHCDLIVDTRGVYHKRFPDLAERVYAV